MQNTSNQGQSCFSKPITHQSLDELPTTAIATPSRLHHSPPLPQFTQSNSNQLDPTQFTFHSSEPGSSAASFPPHHTPSNTNPGSPTHRTSNAFPRSTNQPHANPHQPSQPQQPQHNQTDQPQPHRIPLLNTTEAAFPAIINPITIINPSNLSIESDPSRPQSPTALSTTVSSTPVSARKELRPSQFTGSSPIVKPRLTSPKQSNASFQGSESTTSTSHSFHSISSSHNSTQSNHSFTLSADSTSNTMDSFDVVDDSYANMQFRSPKIVQRQISNFYDSLTLTNNPQQLHTTSSEHSPRRTSTEKYSRSNAPPHEFVSCSTAFPSSRVNSYHINASLLSDHTANHPNNHFVHFQHKMIPSHHSTPDTNFASLERDVLPLFQHPYAADVEQPSPHLYLPRSNTASTNPDHHLHNPFPYSNSAMQKQLIVPSQHQSCQPNQVSVNSLFDSSSLPQHDHHGNNQSHNVMHGVTGNAISLSNFTAQNSSTAHNSFNSVQSGLDGHSKETSSSSSPPTSPLQPIISSNNSSDSSRFSTLPIDVALQTDEYPNTNGLSTTPNHPHAMISPNQHQIAVSSNPPPTPSSISHPPHLYDRTSSVDLNNTSRDRNFAYNLHYPSSDFLSSAPKSPTYSRSPVPPHPFVPNTALQSTFFTARTLSQHHKQHQTQQPDSNLIINHTDKPLVSEIANSTYSLHPTHYSTQPCSQDVLRLHNPSNTPSRPFPLDDHSTLISDEQCDKYTEHSLLPNAYYHNPPFCPASNHNPRKSAQYSPHYQNYSHLAQDTSQRSPFSPHPHLPDDHASRSSYTAFDPVSPHSGYPLATSSPYTTTASTIHASPQSLHRDSSSLTYERAAHSSSSRCSSELYDPAAHLNPHFPAPGSAELSSLGLASPSQTNTNFTSNASQPSMPSFDRTHAISPDARKLTNSTLQQTRTLKQSPHSLYESTSMSTRNLSRPQFPSPYSPVSVLYSVPRQPTHQQPTSPFLNSSSLPDSSYPDPRLNHDHHHHHYSGQTSTNSPPSHDSDENEQLPPHLRDII